MTNFKALDNDLKAAICVSLSAFDLYQLAQTCKAFKKFVFGKSGDAKLWKPMTETEYAFFVQLDEGSDFRAKGFASRAAKALRQFREEHEDAFDSWKATYRYLGTRQHMLERSFFSADYTRADVEAILATKPTGTYVVRPSSQSKLDCVLSANADGRIQHHLLVVMGAQRGCMLMGRYYRTLASLLVGQQSVRISDPMDKAPKLQDGLHETQEKLTSVLKRKKKTIKDKNLLHRACQWGLVEQAEALINDFDVDVNAADNEEGQTALHCCVTTFLRADMTSVVSLLLDKKADVNARDAEGATPLPLPTPSVVRLLVTRGKADLTASRNGLPVPHMAVARGLAPLLAIILDASDASALCKLKGARGETLLHVAAQYGRQDCMSLLLERGSDIEATDNDGMRPLHYAVKEEQEWLGLHMFGRPVRQMYPFAVCQFLASKGADVNATDNDGHSALWHAAFKGASDVAAAKRAAVDGRSDSIVARARQLMSYLIFCGMNCDMDGFEKTVAAQYDTIDATLAEAKSNNNTNNNDDDTVSPRRKKKKKKTDDKAAAVDEDDKDATTDKPGHKHDKKRAKKHRKKKDTDTNDDQHDDRSSE